MRMCKEHPICREEQVSSTALITNCVARITPSPYSVRQAIGRYRHIQNEEVNQPSSVFVTVLG
ncbi:hypothetical protein ABDX87_19350 [Pseudomonas abietaniphila]|uniref:hypothetical protein n=1 Tax=Pseudomonas abietaniphila TaxID=89065 RepID=UPI0032179011